MKNNKYSGIIKFKIKMKKLQNIKSRDLKFCFFLFSDNSIECCFFCVQLLEAPVCLMIPETHSL